MSMLLRFDPFREMDRLLEQRTSQPRQTSMPMDAYRHGDEFTVLFDLPGVDPASIDLEVERNVLTVQAQREWRPGEGDEVLASERPHGRFSRQLLLGDGLDAENTRAHYEHGVLTLTIPVAEKAKPRKVSVSVDGGREAINATSS